MEADGICSYILIYGGEFEVNTFFFGMFIVALMARLTAVVGVVIAKTDGHTTGAAHKGTDDRHRDHHCVVELTFLFLQKHVIDSNKLGLTKSRLLLKLYTETKFVTDTRKNMV